MMRLLKNIILFIVIFFLGYFTSATGILDGTDLGQTLDDAVYSILSLRDSEVDNGVDATDPNQSTVSHLDTVDSLVSVDSSSVATEKTLPRESDGEMNLALLEEEIFTRVNQLRLEKELHTLEENDTLKQAAQQRAKEASVSFSHTRPSGQETFTILEKDEFFYPYQYAGENLGMGTAHGDEATMAQFLFDGWVESEDHYEAMINPNFNELGVGAYMSDNLIYAAQLFGTQRY